MIAPRRDFLRNLAALPLIGGGVTLIGQPTAAAEPITPNLLEAYKTWLDHESRFLAWEMAANPAVRARYLPLDGGTDRKTYFEAIRGTFVYVGDAGHYHHGKGAEPSTRAALVLSAVGCGWLERRR